jgi:hypothetical protein
MGYIMAHCDSPQKEEIGPHQLQNQKYRKSKNRKRNNQNKSPPLRIKMYKSDSRIYDDENP